jgi:amino acid adenylation domain-containing protein
MPDYGNTMPLPDTSALNMDAGDNFMNIVELFEEQVARRPAARAVLSGEDELTYKELNEYSNQIARYLQGLGIGPEKHVAVCLERSGRLVAAMLGVLKAGGSFIPLDPGYPAARLSYMLRDSAAQLLLVHQKCPSGLALHNAVLVDLSAEQQNIRKQSKERVNSGIDAKNAVYIIYTSGSTGLPKGVVVEHRNLLNLVKAQEQVFRVTPEDKILQFASFSFDASVFEIFMALSAGATLVMAEREQLMPGPGMVAFLETCGVTQITIPPSVLRHLPDASLSQLRQIIVAGEAFDVQLAQRWSPGREFFNAYGPTEATVWASISRCEAESQHVTIGQAISNVQLHVVDEEGSFLNETGEICIGGAGVARGYWNRPDLTAERFVPDCFSNVPGSRMYRTGDLGDVGADGAVTFMGRKDDQVKVRGHRVELREIEIALAQHSGVSEAVVVAVTGANGDKSLVGYVVTHEGTVFDDNALRRELAHQLPAYMVPSHLVVLNAFPLTSNGKIDRKALAANWVQPVLPHREPQTAAEEAVVESCSSVLGLSTISLNATFMDMGGSSLNAAQVAALIRDALSIEVPLKDLLSTKTLAEVAGGLANLQPSISPPQLQIRQKPRAQELPPASFSQERVWFLSQIDGSSVAYNANAKLLFSGDLDVSALERALNTIVARHEIYRTTFVEIEGRLFQKIHGPWPVDLGAVDLTELEAQEQAQRAEEIFNQQSRRIFRLTELPLVRWRLVRLDQKRHELFVTEHHVIHDGWSFNVFLKELTELYLAYVNGSEPRISASPLQFADFAQWQREFAESGLAQVQLEYWKKTLAGAPPLLSLPYDRPRPAVQTYRGSVESVEISEELQHSLALMSRTSQATQYMLFAAAFQILLFKYNRQEDFCIGTAVANRRWAASNDLIGMLVDNVALRARIKQEAAIHEHIRQVRETTLEAYAHQDIPFDKVVQAVSPERDLSYNPIFQVTFSFHDSPLVCANLGDLALKVEPAVSNGSAKFDLNVVMIPAQGPSRDSRPRLSWEYNTDLFDRETVLQMVRHYLRILETVALRPHRTLAEISCLDHAEYSQIVGDWNRTEAHLPRHCFHVLFEQQAARTPNAVAVRFDGRELCYSQLNQRANQLAHYLQSRGAHPETLVGIYLERGFDLIIGLLGTLKVGAAYVPLDPALPADRMQYMLEDSGASILLTGSAQLAELPTGNAQVLCLDKLWPELSELPTQNIENKSDPDSLVYVIYTSGSTGKPKGVMVQHRGLVNVLVSFQNALNVTESDTVLATTTLSFDIAAVELYLPLLAGGVLVIAGPLQNEMQHLANKAGREHVSILQGTPTLWNLLATQEWDASAKQLKILCGGEALEGTTAERLLPISKSVWNLYGPTETSICSSIFELGSWSGNIVPIGKPIRNTQMYVLDDNMQPSPVKIVGDLYIGGTGLARGYKNRPDLTAEKFVPDPFALRGGGRLYSTGDLARWRADGILEFVGRKDYQVKIRGYRIELGEIESALLDHEAVKQAVVVAWKNEHVDKRLVAYVVPAEGKTLSVSALLAMLKGRLPEYMLPSQFVVLDSLPQTANGKIDRKSLPDPEATSAALEQPYVAPQTVIEKGLTQIWATILHVERIGIHDNFFLLGGHSLLATQVISRVRKTYQVDLPLRSIFLKPTVAQFAQAVEEAVIQKLETLSEQEAEELLAASGQGSVEYQ